ncbi:hypothetical protein [Streptomyces sp. NPDC054797]
MKRAVRLLGIGTAALGIALMSTSTAHADTVFKDSGAKHTSKGCTNYVFMWNAGDKMYAYGQMNCDVAPVSMRPRVALSGNNGVTFVSSGKGCTYAKTCRTPTVTVKATKGWTYRASNPGTASAGVMPGRLDDIWPAATVAFVKVTL